MTEDAKTAVELRGTLERARLVLRDGQGSMRRHGFCNADLHHIVAALSHPRQEPARPGASEAVDGAHLNELERVAKAADDDVPGGWHIVPPTRSPHGNEAGFVAYSIERHPDAYVAGGDSEAIDAHIAGFDPPTARRLIAEVRASRAEGDTGKMAAALRCIRANGDLGDGILSEAAKVAETVLASRALAAPQDQQQYETNTERALWAAEDQQQVPRPEAGCKHPLEARGGPAGSASAVSQDQQQEGAKGGES